MGKSTRYIDKALDSADSEILYRELTRVLRRTGLAVARLDVIPNRSQFRSGTHPNESIDCVLDDESKLSLFLKYSKHYRAPSYRHRAGIEYEAEVYRHLLEPFSGPTPRLVAGGKIAALGVSYLLLEQLDGILRISKTPSGNMPRASDWIGRFHARYEAQDDLEFPPFLFRYDLEYYRQWPRQACRLTRPLHGEFPWIERLCNAFEERLIPVLLDSTQTVIHGEYYPKNILAQGQVIYPVDWESTAVAGGEIDLASQVEGWSPEIVRECCKAYCRARWPNGTPQSFQATFDAAQVYFFLRWLGDGPYFATGDKGRRRLSLLGNLAQKTGLLQ